MLDKHAWKLLFITLLATVSLATPSLTPSELSLRDGEAHNRTLHSKFGGTSQSDTTYEELTCLGFSPVKKLLSATFEVKLPFGFGGDLCTTGSWEYVRFYADQDGGGWQDLGFASFNTHDILDKNDCEGKPTKPLLYTVSIDFDPTQKSCKTPVLPKVRAILSWNAIPPPGTPEFIPVWGNHLDENIQPLATECKKQSSDDVLDEGNHDKHKHTHHRKANHTDAHADALSNTHFEELTCLGLDSDHSKLVATVHIKQDHGYFATPCDLDSFEYVSFWADWEDCCSWTFLGTRKFNVHDFKPLPDGGLMYTALMPVELSPCDCHKPKIARVRAALAWNEIPPTPPSVATWGNFIETHVQLPKK